MNGATASPSTDSVAASAPSDPTASSGADSTASPAAKTTSLVGNANWLGSDAAEIPRDHTADAEERVQETGRAEHSLLAAR